MQRWTGSTRLSLLGILWCLAGIPIGVAFAEGGANCPASPAYQAGVKLIAETGTDYYGHGLVNSNDGYVWIDTKNLTGLP
jgi:hypothetical protein